MTLYNYNDYLGEETLEKEYKLFTFHPKGINLDTSNIKYIEELFITGKWIFNDIVLKNLNHYFNYYIPKYSTAFLNKYSNIQKGELYIGVSDDGLVHGIPFKGELDITKIYKNISNILVSDKIVTDTNIMDYIDIELINVSIDNSRLIHSTQQQLIHKYLTDKQKYQAKLTKFKKNISRWYDLLNYYGAKLSVMLNKDTNRKELIEYIQKHDKTQYKVIELLKSNHVFKEIPGEIIATYKEKKDNVWYWICRWKDDKLDFIKSIKPIAPLNHSSKIYPLNILVTIIDMIPTWIKKENINLYLIKIIFKKPSKDLDISYKNTNGQIISCYRDTCVYNGPSCEPF